LPKATFIDFHSCGRFHSAFLRTFFLWRFGLQKEEGPRLRPGAQDPCHQPTWFRSKSITTDPKKSLTPAALSELTKNDVDQLLQTGLADFSLRELLGLLISTAGTAERSVYLEKEPTDKPNGFYDRSLQL